MSATAAPPQITARAGFAADAIGGVMPKEVFVPASVDEAARVLAEKAREKSRVAFVGGGTALALGNAPRGLDVVLQTRRLNRIVEHAPSDQVVVVEAGLTLAELQAALAREGQRLALDPPNGAAATIGGLIATNAFGPLRTRFGSLRDLIIGITLVRADGIAARGGGKVVKNVAGFDLPKMMVGSLGTLGLIAQAAFRLHPLPEIETTVLVPGRTAREVRALVVLMRDAQLEPATVTALLEGQLFDVAIRFESFTAGVAGQRDRLLKLVGQTPGTACDVLSETEARTFWERHDACRTAGPLRARIAMLPSAFEEFFERVLPALRATFSEASFAFYPTLGLGFVAGEPEEAARTAQALETARASLVRGGGSLVLEESPEDLRPLVDAWGPPPPAFALMRRLKARLDPEGRLNPGRFVGGI